MVTFAFGQMQVRVLPPHNGGTLYLGYQGRAESHLTRAGAYPANRLMPVLPSTPLDRQNQSSTLRSYMTNNLCVTIYVTTGQLSAYSDARCTYMEGIS